MGRSLRSATASLFVVMATVALTWFPVASTEQCSLRQVWQPMLSSACQDESQAIQCIEAHSASDCALLARAVKGFNVAQWRADNGGGCCVFAHQRVCRQPAAGATGCFVFSPLARLADFARSLSDRLVGLWVTNPVDAGGEFVDVACGSAGVSGNRLVHSNVAWSAEGAAFNGVNSYMLLNTTDVLDYSRGLTWLMRLRRTPRVQPFMEFVRAWTGSVHGAHLWEFNLASRLYFYNRMCASPYETIFSGPGVLPNDASAWVNVGVTLNPSAKSIKFFVGDSFLPDGQYTKTSITAASGKPVAMLIGHRWKTANWLKGTVSAVAVANASMTQEEIRRFFATLP